jgi:hypothetical protein
MITTPHNWEQFALLLIDVQRDFWSERAAHVHPDFPANIAALLTLCRLEALKSSTCGRASAQIGRIGCPNICCVGVPPAFREPQE